MDPVAWIAITAASGIALIVAWQQADRRQQFGFAPVDDATKRVAQADLEPALQSRTGGSPPAADPYAGLPNSYVLVEPPAVVGMAGPMSLRDWLVHGHPERNNVWADVVSEFYERAALDPDISGFFAGVDTSPLQRHSLATLMLITGHGLTVGVVKQMQTIHSDVRNPRGEPITPEVYDATMGVLNDILMTKGVPADTRRQVQRVLTPVREVIVVRSDEECDR